MTFKSELEELINKHNMEDGSDTADYILAEYLMKCLTAFESATRDRDSWYKFDPNKAWDPEA